MSAHAAATFTVILGATLMAMYLPDLVQAIRSRSWPRHRAHVVSSRFDYGLVAHTRVPKIGSYELVEYRYTVPDRFARKGHTRDGARLRFGPVSPLTAQRFVREHPEGTEIDVAVNPRNFDDAVLVPGPSFRLLASALLGVITFGCGVWWMAVSLGALAA